MLNNKDNKKTHKMTDRDLVKQATQEYLDKISKIKSIKDNNVFINILNDKTIEVRKGTAKKPPKNGFFELAWNNGHEFIIYGVPTITLK